MRTLTARQKEVAVLVARGLTARAIASDLDISQGTVAMHVKQAAQRLGGDGPPRHRLALWVYRLDHSTSEGAA